MVTRDLRRQAGRGGDDALGVLGQDLLIDARFVVVAFELRRRGQLEQIAIVRLILRQQQLVVARGVLLALAQVHASRSDIGFHADNGLDVAVFSRLVDSTAPNMTPWSVSARLSMPCFCAASSSFSMRARPSSREYSEWQCRWAKEGAAIEFIYSHIPRPCNHFSTRGGIVGL